MSCSTFVTGSVEHADDDGVGADELFDVLDGLLEHSGLDGHEDQVNRLALLRRDIVEMALFAVADHRLGRVAGNALRVRNDLHAGHLPAKEDAQRTQADEGRSLDFFHEVPLLFQLFSKFRLCAEPCRPRARYLPRRCPAVSARRRGRTGSFGCRSLPLPLRRSRPRPLRAALRSRTSALRCAQRGNAP